MEGKVEGKVEVKVEVGDEGIELQDTYHQWAEC